MTSIVTRSMSRIDSLIDELTNATTEDQITGILDRMEEFSNSALFGRFFEKKAWSALEDYVGYTEGLPDFPFDRLNRDIMVEWIEADKELLLRKVITDTNVPFMVIREFYSDDEHLLHVAAKNYRDDNEIFLMLLQNLPEDFLKIGLIAPDSFTEDAFNNDDDDFQFRGNLPVELLFEYDRNGTIEFKEYHWRKIRTRIMPLLPPLMFGMLEEFVPDDEKIILLGTMNTVGRLITRVDLLSLAEASTVYSPILDYFRRYQQKIITLFEDESSMEWLFKKWNYVWNENKWVKAEAVDDFEPNIDILGDDRNQDYWIERGYAWDEDEEEWVDWEPERYEFGDDRNLDYWMERGYIWDEDNEEWVDWKPERYEEGDDRNQEHWIELGYAWDEENKKWVEPDRFSNSRLSQEWFPRRGYEWSEGLRQWLKRDDFKPLYFTEPHHMIGAKDVVDDTVFGIERTIASVEFDRVLCEDGTANLANLKFVRIDVQYQGLNKDIEPFDMVLCNNTESFVKEIKRTGTGPTDVKVNVKVSQEREDACKLNELTYLKNGENCLWRSLPQNGQLKLETEDQSKIVRFAKDEYGTVVAREGDFDGRDVTSIEIFDKDHKLVGDMIIEETIKHMCAGSGLIAMAGEKILYMSNREGKAITMSGQGSSITCLAYCDKSKQLAVGLYNNEIRVFVNRTRKLTLRPSAAVQSIDIDDNQIVASSNYFVTKWKLEGTNVERLEFDIEVKKVAIEGDTTLVLLVDGTLNMCKNFSDLKLLTDRCRGTIAISKDYIIHDIDNDELIIIDRKGLPIKSTPMVRISDIAIDGNTIYYTANGTVIFTYTMGGEAYTARYEDEKMVVHDGSNERVLNHKFNAIEYFFVHFKMDRKFKIGQYYAPLEGDKGVIIEGFEQGEIRVSDFESGVPLQQFLRFIKPDDFSSKYNIYNTENVAPQADIPKVGETWINRCSGDEVTIRYVNHYVEFSLGNLNRFYSLDTFRYLFQIKPEIGDEWIDISYSRLTPFSSRLLDNGWYNFFWEYKPAPPPQEVEDRNAKSINIGDMVNLPGYALPWKIIDVVGLKLRVKKLKPQNTPEKTMLVDPQDVVFYYRPNLPDEIQLGQSYPTLKFRYDELPTEENSLCMDIGSKVDCDIGEFTTTKFQPVKIMTDMGWEKDGEGILTVFCAKELKDWFNTPEVATELDMGGYERRNFDANSVRVYESNRLKEISPFTNNTILAVEYMTQEEIDEQVALVSEDNSDVQKEIEALESRISNLQRQIDNTPSERVKAFLQQQLNTAQRTLMALRASASGSGSGSGSQSLRLRF